jgi:diguanylate cyclase
MYRAKHGGRGRYELFDPADRTAESLRASHYTALRQAVHDDHRLLHYQPIIDLAAREQDRVDTPVAPAEDCVAGVEALVRWAHADGLRLPGEFLPVAERSGLMDDIGAWVLATACRQLATWDRELGDRAPARLYVNASVQELSRPDLPERVRAVLDEHGIDPGRITVEITENGLLTDPDAAVACLQGLLGLGCRLALDDFGTGYSSLSRLLDLPTAALKIDRSFARTLPNTTTAAAVVAAVLVLGRDLDRDVVVEGVETSDALRSLRALGCRFVQGFHLARPVPAELITALLQPAPAA